MKLPEGKAAASRFLNALAQGDWTINQVQETFDQHDADEMSGWAEGVAIQRRTVEDSANKNGPRRLEPLNRPRHKHPT